MKITVDLARYFIKLLQDVICVVVVFHHEIFKAVQYPCSSGVKSRSVFNLVSTVNILTI